MTCSRGLSGSRWSYRQTKAKARLPADASWSEYAPIYAQRRAEVAAALEELRLPRIAASTRTKLDIEGFAVLPQLVDGATCEKLARAIMKTADLEGDKAAMGGHLEHGVARVTGLLGRSDEFDRFVFNLQVLALVARILEADLQLSTLTARAPFLNGGDQELHRDWHAPAAGGKYQAVNVIWALDQFTEENGAPRLAPGTHTMTETLDKTHEAVPTGRDIPIAMPAGSALVYNAHLWHKGGRNRSGARRVGLHAFFTRTCYPQLSNLRETLQGNALGRYTAAERAVLNVP
jgi:hypothetical protein